jgi:hypothetical protein
VPVPGANPRIVKNSFLQKKRNPEELRRRSTKGGGLDGYALASAKMPIWSDRSKLCNNDSAFVRDKTERTSVYLTATLLNDAHNCVLFFTARNST